MKIFTWAAVGAVDVVCRLSGWAVEANRLGLTWVRLWLKSEYYQRGDRFHDESLATHYLGLLREMK